MVRSYNTSIRIIRNNQTDKTNEAISLEMNLRIYVKVILKLYSKFQVNGKEYEECMHAWKSNVAVDVASKFLSRSRDEIAGSAIEKRITRTRRGENEPRKWSATPKTGRVLTRRKLRATTRFSTERNRATGGIKRKRTGAREGGRGGGKKKGWNSGI